MNVTDEEMADMERARACSARQLSRLLSDLRDSRAEVVQLRSDKNELINALDHRINGPMMISDRDVLDRHCTR